MATKVYMILASKGDDKRLLFYKVEEINDKLMALTLKGWNYEVPSFNPVYAPIYPPPGFLDD